MGKRVSNSKGAPSKNRNANPVRPRRRAIANAVVAARMQQAAPFDGATLQDLGRIRRSGLFGRFRDYLARRIAR